MEGVHVNRKRFDTESNLTCRNESNRPAWVCILADVLLPEGPKFRIGFKCIVRAIFDLDDKNVFAKSPNKRPQRWAIVRRRSSSTLRGSQRSSIEIDSQDNGSGMCGRLICAI